MAKKTKNTAASASTNAQVTAEPYTDPNAIAAVVRLRDVGALTQGLTPLRDQLAEATAIRVDPAATYTRPLVEYVQSCNDCSELLDLWTFQSMNNIQALECLVPEVIGYFMRLCTTPIIRPFGLQLAKKVLESFMKQIYRGIASARIPQCMSTFKVLSAICSLGQLMTRELVQNFNFQTEGFLRASRYRQAKKTKNPKKYLYDLRTYYVRFVLAIFMHGDVEAKKQALGVKNLISALFNGLDQDAYKLMNEIFSVMSDHLLLDASVPKSVKLHVFSPHILDQISRVYAREEPEPIGDDETAVPAKLAHDFLLKVCTVPGAGLCARGMGWYTPVNIEDGTASDKGQNRLLSKFITMLKPSDNLRQQELVYKILAANPELIAGYWQNAPISLEPRVSSKWLANITLLQKVVRLPVPSLYYGNTKLYPLKPPSVSTMLENILPNVFGRAVSNKGLLSSSPLVQYVTILFLSASFIKYSEVLSSLEKAVTTLSQAESALVGTADNDISHVDQWKRAITSLREGFRRRIPDLNTLITVYQKASSLNEQEIETEDDIAVQRQMLQDSALRLIGYYQRYLPESVMEAMIDASIFIPKDILSARPEYLVHLLELLLYTPDFKWTNKTTKSSFSPLTTLLTLYLQTPHPHIGELTGRLIRRTMSDSFMFRHDPNEIVCWLEAMPKSDISKGELSKEQLTVLQFMDECMDRFNRAQYRYTDQLAGLASQLGDNDVSSISTAQDTLGGDSILPFSPLLLTALQHLKPFKGEKRHVELFISRLTILLLLRRKMPHLLQGFARARQQMDNFWENSTAESSSEDTLNVLLSKLQNYSLTWVQSSCFDDNDDRNDAMDFDGLSTDISLKTLDTNLRDAAKHCMSTLDLSTCNELKASLAIISQVTHQILAAAQADSSEKPAVLAKPFADLFVQTLDADEFASEGPKLDHDTLHRYCFETFIEKFDLQLVRETCDRLSIDVPTFVLDGLKNAAVLAPNVIQLIELACENITEKSYFVISVVDNLLDKLSEAIDASKMRTIDIHDSFYRQFAEFLDSIELDWTALNSETVRDFILNTLLDNFGNAAAITFTGYLISHIYKGYDKLEPLQTYMRRVLEHVDYESLTAPTMRTQDSDAAPSNTEQREAIIKLIYILHSIQPAILGKNLGLLDPLLTSYSATTSQPDRMILEILKSCEKSAQTSMLPKLLFWGPGSDKARQAHAQAGLLLDPETVSMEIFGLIDSDLMEYTFTHFPKDFSFTTTTVYDRDSPLIYDASFFVPLFANLLANKKIDLKGFITSNGLGLVLVLLSAIDKQVRMVGYQMMDQFYELLKQWKFSLQEQYLFMLDSFRDAIVGRSETDVPPRIPPAITISVARGFSILAKPTHYMYLHYEKWLTQRPTLSLQHIPIAPAVLSSSVDRKERLWALRLLSSSIRTFEDYKMFSRSRLWDTVTMLYNSAIIDKASKQEIINIISHALSDPDTAVSLVQHHGLIAWIHQILALSDDEDEIRTWTQLQQKLLSVS